MIITGSVSPTVSVIISTFNWSAALRCALASVKLQTMSDFEVLVVGDGCTDDSEAVVASFNDSRFKWHNLERNHGGQWAPNNHGLAVATGEWVAYLGHDDIWHPAHLESALQTAHERDADWVTSVMISYGPPSSGIRGLSGLLIDGVAPSNEFMPPSSVLHRKSVVDQVGYWKDPETTGLPSDCEFLKRAIEAGARIVSTKQLTAFKFNAAWRRDAYVLKSTSEQEDMLAKIREGDEFLHGELLEVLQAVVAGKFVLMKMPDPAQYKSGLVKSYRKFKGAEQHYTSTDLREIENRERFFLPDQFAAFEWHLEEHHPKFGSFRWSGPLPRATVDLPVRFNAALRVVVHVIGVIQWRQLETLELFINDRPVRFETERTADGTFQLSAVAIPSKLDSQHGLRLSLKIEKPQRPIDLGKNEDSRWLGVAVNWIEINPV
jgi:glycosyltransferase involved in cell wall biosynthesis